MLWRGKSRNFEDILSAFLNYSSSSKTGVESNINLTFPNFHLIMLDASKEYDHTNDDDNDNDDGGNVDKAVEQAINLGCQVRESVYTDRVCMTCPNKWYSLCYYSIAVTWAVFFKLNSTYLGSYQVTEAHMFYIV